MRANRPVSDLSWIIGWLILLWAIALADRILQNTIGFNIEYFGVWPRSARGLIGILTAPFLHAGFVHVAANSVSLFILGLAGCSYSRRLTFAACIYSSIFAGTLTWLIGEKGKCHIGASGVVLGLVGFLIANGIVRRGIAPLFLSLVILALYGGLIFSSVLPNQAHAQISWEMHLGGFIGGLFASWKLRKKTA